MDRTQNKSYLRYDIFANLAKNGYTHELKQFYHGLAEADKKEIINGDESYCDIMTDIIDNDDLKTLQWFLSIFSEVDKQCIIKANIDKTTYQQELFHWLFGQLTDKQAAAYNLLESSMEIMNLACIQRLYAQLTPEQQTSLRQSEFFQDFFWYIQNDTRIDIAQWMLAQSTETEKATILKKIEFEHFVNAVRHGAAVESLRWFISDILINLSPEQVIEAIKTALHNGHLATVQWLMTYCVKDDILTLLQQDNYKIARLAIINSDQSQDMLTWICDLLTNEERTSCLISNNYALVYETLYKGKIEISQKILLDLLPPAEQAKAATAEAYLKQRLCVQSEPTVIEYMLPQSKKLKILRCDNYALIYHLANSNNVTVMKKLLDYLPKEEQLLLISANDFKLFKYDTGSHPFSEAEKYLFSFFL